MDGRLSELVKHAASSGWHLRRTASGEVTIETTVSAEASE